MYDTGEELEKDLVLSDVHLYNRYTTTPTDNFALTRFYFSYPQTKLSSHDEESEKNVMHRERGQTCECEKDEDGDLVVERLTSHQQKKDVITIEHTLATPLSHVGTQVWRGSLLLCDFLVHHEADFEGSVALELGGGVGLCSIVMARVAKRVFCTDISEVLGICEQNRIRNEDLFKYNSKDNPVMIVRELNFFKPLLALDHPGSGFQWTNDEREELKRVSVIIAADVIYDDCLTDAFLETTVKLFDCNPNAVLYLALEKRLNFTLAALRVASPAHDHFTTKMNEMEKKDGLLNSKKLPTTFPKYSEYDRVKELELWEIRKGSAV